MPPIEAMACGCPVISSARGSLAEVIGDAAAVVDPENVIQLKNTLAHLAGSARERERLRLLGFERAKLFNWEKSARETMDVYNRAVLSKGTLRQKLDDQQATPMRRRALVRS